VNSKESLLMLLHRSYQWLSSLYTVSKNDTDVAHYNFNGR